MEDILVFPVYPQEYPTIENILEPYKEQKTIEPIDVTTANEILSRLIPWMQNEFIDDDFEEDL